MALDVLVYSADSTGWSNILRFASTEGYSGTTGQRVPTIYTIYNETLQSGFLQINSDVSGDVSYTVVSAIDLNKWYHIEINQERNIVNGKVCEFNQNQFLYDSVNVNGVGIESVENTNPQSTFYHCRIGLFYNLSSSISLFH